MPVYYFGDQIRFCWIVEESLCFLLCPFFLMKNFQLNSYIDKTWSATWILVKRKKKEVKRMKCVILKVHWIMNTKDVLFLYTKFSMGVGWGGLCFSWIWLYPHRCANIYNKTLQKLRILKTYLSVFRNSMYIAIIYSIIYIICLQIILTVFHLSFQ